MEGRGASEDAHVVALVEADLEAEEEEQEQEKNEAEGGGSALSDYLA